MGATTSEEQAARIVADIEGTMAAAPALTEDGLAVEFTARHRDELRFVHSWHKWFKWDSARWREDEVLRVFDLARQVCRSRAAALEDKRMRARIASAQTVAAVVRLAATDPVHARSVEPWDADPLLLNTPGGTVDLRTGELRPHDPADCITKITRATPGGACPLWLASLERWTAGEAELQEFLQRLLGYCLTGTTKEHALPFAYGTGGNGKSALLNTVSGILGDYAGIAATETFTATNTDRHPADLAMLRALRLVVAQETEQGRRWDETRIKTLTGGDPVTARFMRQDFFTYIPQFKIIVAGNHKPALRNVDEAIRRRLVLIPFRVTIPSEERDCELPEKLKAEWPGILAWMIQGCIDWQAEGLRPPASVRAATDDYLAAEDSFTAWLEETCVQAPGLVAPNAQLFQSWREWAEARNETPGSSRILADRLDAAGYERVKDVPGCRGRGFRGLGLRA